MKKLITAATVSAGILLSTPALARQVDIEITNLTNGLYFTPLLVAAHNRHTDLFEVGVSASPQLQAMAEGGDTSGLADIVEHAGGVVADVSDPSPADPFLHPGETATASLKIRGHRNAYISITGMFLPSNDGFVGLDAKRLPIRHGYHTLYLNGYDAGTEANDELINEDTGGVPGTPGIPGDPGGVSGSGGMAVAGADNNTTVHIHRGILGGDPGDLDASVHRFNNPIAKVVIKVK